MLMNRIILPVTIACFLIAIVHPVSAAILTATYGGSVFSGTDNTGLFGPPGGSLNGQSFTAVYTYDTAAGNLTIVSGNPTLTDAESVVFTLNGKNFSISDNNNGTLQRQQQMYPYPYSESFDDVISGSNGSDELELSLLVKGYSISTDLLASFTADTSQQIGGGGYFQSTVGGNTTYLSLRPNSLSVATTQISAVPLPGSLPMFSAAVVLLGLLANGVRRRSRNAEDRTFHVFRI